MRLYIKMALLLALPVSSYAKTQSLNSLEKITVGPFDNYDQDIVGEHLVHSQNQFLSTHIRYTKLDGSGTKELIDSSSDSAQVKLSPLATKFAFTYFKNNALGDICYRSIAGTELECITNSVKKESNPNWLSEDLLVFLRENSNISELVQFNLSTKKESQLLKADISTYSTSINSPYLLYQNKQGHLFIYNLNSRKVEKQIHLSLPGKSGPASISDDGKTLLIPQYFQDSNKDSVIDANDSGVIFSLNWQSPNSKPVQLTLNDHDCSYPRLVKKQLYLTCAFEGSLDIYKLPSTGVVPSSWNLEDLQEAHMSSRSSHDRIIYLNHMWARYSNISYQDFLDRSVANFISTQSWLAAYVFLAASEVEQQSELMEATQLISKLDYFQSGRLTKDELATTMKEKGSSPKIKGLIALINQIVAKQKASKRELSIFNTNKLHWRLISDYLWDQLGKETQSHRNYILQQFSQSKNEGEKAYYLYRLLKLNSLFDDKLNFLKDLNSADFDPDVIQIFEAESLLFQIREIKTKKDALPAMRRFNQISQDLREHYFLLRIVYARAMELLDTNENVDERGRLALNWLNQVKYPSKEFPLVVESFRDNSIESAYRYLKNNANAAAGSFFNIIRMSDDLESHLQYARLNSEDSASQDFISRYERMISDKLIDEKSLQFALLIRKINTLNGDIDEDFYKEARLILNNLEDNHMGASIKYLILGYLNQRQFEDSFKGPEFDSNYLEKAHQDYLIALDLAWNNSRVKAAILTNLGLLHAKARNFSLSSEYFKKRTAIEFASDSEKLAFFWHYCKSLFYSNKVHEAYEKSRDLLTLTSEPAWIEKTAFYALYAGKYLDAQALYEDYFKQKPVFQASIKLSYAYALFKLEKPKAALKVFDEIYSNLNGKSSIEAQKILFISSGLASQASEALDSKLLWLNRRLLSYNSILKKPKIFSFNESELLTQKIKDLQKAAIFYQSQSNIEDSRKLMLLSMEVLLETSESSTLFSEGLSTAIKNYLVFTIDHNIKSNEVFEKIRVKLDQEVSGIEDPSPVIARRYLEIYGLTKMKEANEAKSSEFDRKLIYEQSLYAVLEKEGVSDSLDDYLSSAEKHFFR